MKYITLLITGLVVLAFVQGCCPSQGKYSKELKNFPLYPVREAKMLNYTEPEYKLVKQESGLYKIEVTTPLLPETLSSEKAKDTRLEILQREAAKDPLYAIAFIRSLADKGDGQAQQIQVLYRAICQFLKDVQREGIRKTCNILRQDKNLDSLVLSFIDCIDFYFKGCGVPCELQVAHLLLNQLIPNLEQTLTKPLPQKLYPEQRVTTEETIATHRAFPDLIRYKEEYYLSFREAKSHVGFNDFGKIRLLNP